MRIGRSLIAKPSGAGDGLFRNLHVSGSPDCEVPADNEKREDVLHPVGPELSTCQALFLRPHHPFPVFYKARARKSSYLPPSLFVPLGAQIKDDLEF